MSSALTAPSQIAQRQLDYFQGMNLLIAGEVEDNFAQELLPICASVSVFTTHYGYFLEHQANQNISCYFGAQLTQTIQADMILLYWPKAKAEAEYLLAMLLSKLGTGTQICVVGENRSGVKSIEKMFAPYGHIKKYDTARRCSFYWGECHQQVPTFQISKWFKTYTLKTEEQEIIVKSLPGVFSHGEFDLGSQLLIQNLPKLSGKCLDFGCGAGVIGCVMAKLNPNIELHLCDISALAIASSIETLKANHIEGKVFPSHIYSDIGKNYQAIISNPPFHSGLETSYNATETLLAQAPKHLATRGILCIVANSFLKYPPIIEKAFGHCETVDKNRKFAIYQASSM